VEGLAKSAGEQFGAAMAGKWRSRTWLTTIAANAA